MLRSLPANAGSWSRMICETDDLSAWAWFCDHLRETKFWDHYFEVLDIMPALEGNYLA